MLTGLLLATGSGGVPGGGLVVGLVFVKAFGLPVEIAALIGGIYHILDMREHDAQRHERHGRDRGRLRGSKGRSK